MSSHVEDDHPQHTLTLQADHGLAHERRLAPELAPLWVGGGPGSQRFLIYVPHRSILAADPYGWYFRTLDFRDRCVLAATANKMTYLRNICMFV